MPSNFDWQTEEDGRRAQSSWDEEPQPELTPAPGRRVPWRLVAVVTILAAMVAGIIWWRVDQRIDATLEAFRTDVVASHNLIQRAAADGDEEIFRSVLSGRMPAWTTGKLEIFRENLIVDRGPLGLSPVEGSVPAILIPPNEEAADGERVAAIEFSPDLNEAIITIDQPYTVLGTEETVVLQQTNVYRRGDSRWLLAPPLDEFWGDWITDEGEYLSLIYPTRDRAIAERLATDLDAEIARLCSTVDDIDCSADLHLTARLDTDPAVLASLSRTLGPLRRASEREDIIELPTPTVVGLPTGDSASQEAAYDALRDGYARHLLSAVIAQAVSWRCCDDAILFNVLMEYQLGQMGLITWSVDETDQQRVLETRARLGDLSLYLADRNPTQMPAERMWELRAAVDFLINGIPGVSAARMQRVLGRTRNFDQFVDGVLAISEPDEEAALPGNLDLAWWLYAFRGGNEAPTASPPPADEDLYLACTAVDGNQSTDTSTLLRYLPAQARWMEMYNLQGFVWMSALPDPRTLLMQEFVLADEIWRTNIWRDGGIETAYVPINNQYSISLGETDPSGRKLIAYTIDSDEADVRGFIVDLDNCDEGCATTNLPGRPSWSPDGSRAIYVGDGSTYPEDYLVAANDRFIILQSAEGYRSLPISLGPGDASAGSADLTSIGDGRAPFWIDDRTFGYIRRLETDGPIGQGEDEIVYATLDDPTPQMIVTAADIFAFLPENILGRNLSLAYVATHPNQPDKLFIVALDRVDQRAYVIFYDLNNRRPEVRLNLLYTLNHSLSFSPDGRYLVLTGRDRQANLPDDTSGVLLVHDIAENRTYPFMTRLPFFLPSVVYDWTEDGRWLALALEDNLIGLVALEEGVVELLPHGYGSCTSVAWLQP